MVSNDLGNEAMPSKPTKTSKVRVFAAAFAAILIVLAGGAYFATQVFANEAPPSLDAAMDLQGLSKVGKFKFATWDSDDKKQFNKNKEQAVIDDIDATKLSKGVNYLYATKDMTFQDVFEHVDPDADTMAVAKYDPEKKKFRIYPKTTYYNEDATIEVDPDDKSEALIKKGEGFIIVISDESKAYGLYYGNKFESKNEEVCNVKAGWNLLTVKDKEIKKYVAPCFDQIDAIWTQKKGSKGGADFEKLYVKKNTGVAVKNKNLDNSLVWIKFSEDPKEKEVSPEKISDLSAKAGNDIVTVKWTAPESGTSKIDYYDVEYAKYDSMPGVKSSVKGKDIGHEEISAKDYDKDGVEIKLASLPGSGVYGFKVRAINELGYEGEYSSSQYANPTRSFESTKTKDKSSLHPETSKAGSDVRSGSTSTSSSSSDSKAGSDVKSGSTSTTSSSDSKVGSDDRTTESSSVSKIFTAPTNATVESSDNKVVLSWNAPLIMLGATKDSIAPELIGYKITHYNPGDRKTKIDIETKETETSYTFRKEELGDQRTIEIRAIYKDGESEPLVVEYTVESDSDSTGSRSSKSEEDPYKSKADYRSEDPFSNPAYTGPIPDEDSRTTEEPLSTALISGKLGTIGIGPTVATPQIIDTFAVMEIDPDKAVEKIKFEAQSDGLIIFSWDEPKNSSGLIGYIYLRETVNLTNGGLSTFIDDIDIGEELQASVNSKYFQSASPIKVEVLPIYQDEKNAYSNFKFGPAGTGQVEVDKQKILTTVESDAFSFSLDNSGEAKVEVSNVDVKDVGNASPIYADLSEPEKTKLIGYYSFYLNEGKLKYTKVEPTETENAYIGSIFLDA